MRVGKCPTGAVAAAGAQPKLGGAEREFENLWYEPWFTPEAQVRKLVERDISARVVNSVLKRRVREFSAWT